MERSDDGPRSGGRAALSADEELLCCAGPALSSSVATDPERIARIRDEAETGFAALATVTSEEIVALISTCHAHQIDHMATRA